jgi:hypothetical protein
MNATIASLVFAPVFLAALPLLAWLVGKELKELL